MKAERLNVPDEHIKLMYEDGLSQQQIADAIGASQRWVSYRLAKMRVQTRTRSPRNRVADLGW